MVPLLLIIMSSSMFSVALPALRKGFRIEADLTAWLVTAQSLPFMMLMPLYGRMGDILGRKRLLIFGIIVYIAGTILVMVATHLSLFIVGRIVQGIGASAVNPLCLAIISANVSENQRGRALGYWNSIGPVGNFGGPIIAGVLIDYFGWRAIFVPIALVGVTAFWAVSIRVPKDELVSAEKTSLLSFDWLGVGLLGLSTTLLVFYVSSRVITGTPSLLDWRLLLSAMLFFFFFTLREKRRVDPFIDLSIFRRPNFALAALCVGIRQCLMSIIRVLMPLYIVDAFSFSASLTGMLLMLHAVSLFVMMRTGGYLADKTNNRSLVALGLAIQTGSMVLFSFIPDKASPALVVLGLLGHGIGAGLNLPFLHLNALRSVPSSQSGAASGLYSMIRFGGSMIGGALCGVLLKMGIDRSLPRTEAYQFVFWTFVVIGIIGTVSSLRLNKRLA
jgi:MFS family permease